MFGVTNQGNSVMCHVHNFTPYFYVQYNSNMLKFGPVELEELKATLNRLDNGD